MDINPVCPEETLHPFLEILATNLPATFSSDNTIRTNAEQRLKEAATTKNPAFPLAMAVILRDESAPLHIRHLSGVLLKQYIQKLWAVTEGEGVKNTVKLYLLEGTAAQKERQMRTISALCVAKIAAVEWPEHWVDLIPHLMISSGQGQVQAQGRLSEGAIRCLVFLSEEVATPKGPALMEACYPHLLTVLQAQDSPAACRRSAVKVVGCLLHSFHILVMEGSPELSQALAGFIPQWIALATQVLQEQIAAFSMSEGFGISISLIQTLNTAVSSFPELCSGLDQFLNQVWSMLTHVGQQYQLGLQNDNRVDGGPYASDGDCIDLNILISQILEFLCTIAGSPQNSICELLRNPMSEVFRMVLNFIQLTPSQLELWTSDPNEFVAEEEDEMRSVSIRHSGQYLLMELTEIFPKEAFKHLFQVISEHFEGAGKPESSWNWQILEADFFALGRIAQPFIRRLKKAEKKGTPKEQKASQLGFPLESFKAQIFECLNLSSVNNLHILQAQVLSVASEYLVLFTPEEGGLLFQLCIVSLEPPTPLSMRIFACRTLGKLAYSMDEEVGAQPELVEPVTKAIALTAELVKHSTESTAHIMVGTLVELVKISPPSLVAAFQSGVELDQISLLLWEQHAHDPFIIEIVSDLLQKIASDSTMASIIRTRFIGQLEIMMKGQAAQRNPGVLEACINVLKEFVQGMAATSGQSDSEPLLQRGLMLLLELMGGTEDNSLLQAAAQCMKVYLQVVGPALLSWHQGDPSQLLLHQISNHIVKVLGPSSPDAAAMFSGEVVLNLLLQLSAQMSQEDVGTLLGCLLQRIQFSRSKMLTDQLVLVFIRLIIVDPDSITNFLYNSPLGTPLTGTGMDLIFSQWLRLHEDIQTEYLAKVSAVGMLELLGCSLRKAELQKVTAKTNLMIIGPGMDSSKKVANTLIKYEDAELQKCILSILIQTATDLEEVDDNGQFNNEDESEDDLGLGYDGWEKEDDLDNFMTESINQIHGADASGEMESASPFVSYEDFISNGGGDANILSAFAASEDFLYDEAEAENDPLGKVNVKNALAEFMNAPTTDLPMNTKPIDAVLATIPDELQRNQIVASLAALFGNCVIHHS